MDGKDVLKKLVQGLTKAFGFLIEGGGCNRFTNAPRDKVPHGAHMCTNGLKISQTNSGPNRRFEPQFELASPLVHFWVVNKNTQFYGFSKCGFWDKSDFCSTDFRKINLKAIPDAWISQKT